MKESFKNEVEQIAVPEQKLDAAIHSAIRRGKKKRRSFARKSAYSAGTAAALFCLFIGSGFVSPAMAEVASKIPFLNQIFESEPAFLTISEELRKEYKVDATGMSYHPKKEFTVAVTGSEDYYKSVKGEIEERVEDLLAAHGYDALTIDVYHQKPFVPTPEQEQDEKMTRNLLNVIHDGLEESDFNILSVGGSYTNERKTLELQIPETETRTEELKSIVDNLIQEAGLEPVQLTLTKSDMDKQEQEGRWQPVITTISDGLMGRKDYKVKGVGYSNHPEPMTIFITLQLPASDSDAKELAERTEKTVNEFIQSEEAKEAVGDDPYTIVIYSKNREVLLEADY
ncbi:DUF4030 domain-containing protein [Rossellomorea vietnamensis]|uniref:DUF4030 domain-containing protein n=1 Tax=Rossellomorea vietnamensis TaxID=218284 RepID=A0A5D4MC71_9BACI|nr:DUF4030 domain-containing protein [Rossellomorea vietnamensis]TYR98605.1 DUF4030 domain-containing protein [Rossellomorea vietnamensis]